MWLHPLHSCSCLAETSPLRLSFPFFLFFFFFFCFTRRTLWFLAQSECTRAWNRPTVPPALRRPFGVATAEVPERCKEQRGSACRGLGDPSHASFYSCCPEGRQTPGQLVSQFLRQRASESPWKWGRDFASFALVYRPFILLFQRWFATSCSYWPSRQLQHIIPTPMMKGNFRFVLFFSYFSVNLMFSLPADRCLCFKTVLCVCVCVCVCLCVWSQWCVTSPSVTFLLSILSFLMQHPVKSVEGGSLWPPLVLTSSLVVTSASRIRRNGCFLLFTKIYSYKSYNTFFFLLFLNICWLDPCRSPFEVVI